MLRHSIQPRLEGRRGEVHLLTGPTARFLGLLLLLTPLLGGIRVLIAREATTTRPEVITQVQVVEVPQMVYVPRTVFVQVPTVVVVEVPMAATSGAGRPEPVARGEPVEIEAAAEAGEEYVAVERAMPDEGLDEVASPAAAGLAEAGPTEPEVPRLALSRSLAPAVGARVTDLSQVATDSGNGGQEPDEPASEKIATGESEVEVADDPSSSAPASESDSTLVTAAASSATEPRLNGRGKNDDDNDNDNDNDTDNKNNNKKDGAKGAASPSQPAAAVPAAASKVKVPPTPTPVPKTRTSKDNQPADDGKEQARKGDNGSGSTSSGKSRKR